MTASRNGYYFTLDRLTGERLVTSQFSGHRELGRRAQRQGAAAPHSRQGPSRWPARWCRRTTAAPPTGRRRRSAPTPASSTCRAPRAMRCTTSPKLDPRAARWGSAGRTRWGRDHRQLHRRDRLQDRHARVWRHRFQTANSAGRAPGLLGDGGQAALRRRRVGQLLRDGSGQRLDAVARAHRRGVERAADLQGRAGASTCSSPRATRCYSFALHAVSGGKAHESTRT